MMEQKSPAQSVTEVRIIEAAAQLFARHGFKAATTREIAQLADINEVTLFRYFQRKPDLFCAAVNSRLTRVKLGRELQMSLARDEDPAIVVQGDRDLSPEYLGPATRIVSSAACSCVRAAGSKPRNS